MCLDLSSVEEDTEELRERWCVQLHGSLGSHISALPLRSAVIFTLCASVSSFVNGDNYRILPQRVLPL